ncbi:hypothetical protein R3W88_004296 [Solanum pinnatisectum]|uniref:Uncharacterized protein n=1 Tax=Solanum pinnatisectum TaxID=50273 RepID=A0AAV9KA69_9SOLN|nr:hypothetical protein R3W88_004296 [Solanum pinnatisectum]
MHPLSQNEAFDNSENGGKSFNTETNQISFTNELASQPWTNLIEMKNENEKPYNLVDIPMYDKTGLPQNHLKSYLDWLASIGQGNEFNMILFVDMVNDFINQYGPPNSASKGCGLLKSKSIESPEGMKGNESQKKVAESTLGHYCLNEAQSRNKGKTIVTEASNVPPLVPEARKAQIVIPLIDMIRNLQPKPREIHLHPLNPAKQCAFHLGMLGHTTDECQCLKEEIQKLLDSGMIIQRHLEPTS